MGKASWSVKQQIVRFGVHVNNNGATAQMEIKMSDDELLRLAAKAQGTEIYGYNLALASYETNRGSWNPLYSDKDAFQLMIDLKMDVRVWLKVTDIETDEPETITENHDACAYAATRRAILRAAAHIGETIKTKNRCDNE